MRTRNSFADSIIVQVPVHGPVQVLSFNEVPTLTQRLRDTKRFKVSLRTAVFGIYEHPL